VPRHAVACLLPVQTRRALWRELRAGAAPADARAAADLAPAAEEQEEV
jgi:hypothetical protein